MTAQKDKQLDTCEEERRIPSYSETTNGIKVSVYPEYLEEQSDPFNSIFSFSYTVWIENQGSESVQLLGRHWLVCSGGEDFTEVKGEGVVGEQPIIGPGEHFNYSSGASIKDPVGSMYGSYTLIDSGGEIFEVEIPEFDLISNTMIH
ncbi:MAG: Co2+/Mg2+ efflux protein ApaG [Bdellovibrionales bacterium]|nr:Co2+/Mg2+ efflux protein ApaG [Bdellovibrionales bacterium]